MKNNGAYILIGFCLLGLMIVLFYYHKAWNTIKTENTCQIDTVEPTHQQRLPLPVLLDSMQLIKEDLQIRIDKSEYLLFVIYDTLVLRTYPTVFGTDPVSDKLMQGDRATPEGHFKVRAFYPHQSWSKFIWIDYPTEDSWKKHHTAKADNKIPQTAKIGGEIGIHGVPNNNTALITSKTNWTWGCVSLTNEDVNDLFLVVYEGMPIEITP